jgi:lipopolysaccharide exporter
LLGDFYGDARAVPVAQALSLTLFFSALGSTHTALFYRSLQFNRRVVVDILLAGMKGSVSIGLAVAGWSYWSLVVGQLAGQVTYCAAAWVLQPFRPRFEWNGSAARWLLGFGTAILASRVLSSSVEVVGTLIVGSQLGSAALGIYTLGSRLPQLLLLTTFSILSTVLFPVYARLLDDPDGLRKGYIVAQRYMALFALPTGVAIIAVSPLFLHVCCGPLWEDAAPVMQILGLGGGIAAIGWHAGDIAKAMGRARLQLLLSAVPVFSVIPLLLFAARSSGLIGVAGAYAGSYVIGIVVNVLTIRYLLEVPVLDSLRAVGPGAAAALGVGVTMVGLLWLSEGWWDLPRLIGVTTLGAIVYAGVVSFVAPDLRNWLIAFLRRAAVPLNPREAGISS